MKLVCSLYMHEAFPFVKKFLRKKKDRVRFVPSNDSKFGVDHGVNFNDINVKQLIE